MEDLKEEILSEYKNGNIVLNTIDGLVTGKLSDFIEQHTDGLLYDLNLTECSILSSLDDPRWINELATNKVIKELKNKISTLETEKLIKCDKPSYDELLYALKETHNLYLENVKNIYGSHDITRMISNDYIFKRLENK